MGGPGADGSCRSSSDDRTSGSMRNWQAGGAVRIINSGKE